MLDRQPPQLVGQRRDPVDQRLPHALALAQPARGAAEARVAQHPLQQLAGRLGGRELVELLDLLARQHQPRLQLQQRGDQDEELGGGLEVELVARLQVVEVGEHDLGQLDLEQVELLAQDQRQQEVERPREDVEVELQPVDGGGGHPALRLGIGADRPPSAPRTSTSVSVAIARARSAPAARMRSSSASSLRSSA